MAPIITLTTDFGTRDPYVAEVKGVILGLAPGVTVVDVTHEVQAHDVLEGALAVEAAFRTFPPGTIHVAVVDPGVGTARRPLVVAAGRHLFVGPDNGLLTAGLRAPSWRAWELTAPGYRRRPVSRTFHGRDVFAPAAAHLARGVPPRRFGRPVVDPVRLPWPGARVSARGVAGTVLHVDRFGNLITSIDAEAVDRLVRAAGSVTVRVAGRALPLVGTFGDLAPGRAGGLIGSRQRLEVAVRDGQAARTLGVRRGAPVVVSSVRSRSASRSRKAPSSRRRC